jgi:hypothetical protein
MWTYAEDRMPTEEDESSMIARKVLESVFRKGKNFFIHPRYALRRFHEVRVFEVTAHSFQ